MLLTLGSVISVYEDGKRGGALILTGLLGRYFVAPIGFFFLCLNSRVLVAACLTYILILIRKPRWAVFIPGSYSTSIIYGAYRSWPGYNYDQVPSYD